jgi:hypothetical protein
MAGARAGGSSAYGALTRTQPGLPGCQQHCFHSLSKQGPRRTRLRGHCGAKFFLKVTVGGSIPSISFLAACWSSCTRDFGRRRPVRVCRPRGKSGRQSRGTGTEPTWPRLGPARVQPRIRPANGPTGPDPTGDPICRGPTDPDPTEDPTRQWTHRSGSN